MDENIDFTMEMRNSKCRFLCVTHRSGWWIYTNRHLLEIYGHSYVLYFKSCHSKHAKLNIPFDLTITNTESAKNQRLNDLKKYLKGQN